MTNTIKTLPEGCAESWGIPLSKAVPGTFEVVGGFADKSHSNIAQNTSKNKALLDFGFGARLANRVDSEHSGEQAHV